MTVEVTVYGDSGRTETISLPDGEWFDTQESTGGLVLLYVHEAEDGNTIAIFRDWRWAILRPGQDEPDESEPAIAEGSRDDQGDAFVKIVRPVELKPATTTGELWGSITVAGIAS